MNHQKKIKFASRLEQNSKNYSPEALYDVDACKEFLEQMHKAFGLEAMVTDRHGAVVITVGDFSGFVPDVVNAPGIKIRVKGRTVSHVYARFDKVSAANKEVMEKTLAAYIKTLEGYSEKSYLASEQAVYIDELEEALEKDAYQTKYDEQKDPLTGVLNQTYFGKRMKDLTAQEVVPAAVICANINDWKFVNDHFGEEESDRLIVTVADILKRCATDEMVIGRVDGDVFHVIIPYDDEGVALGYCQKVQQECADYEDAILAPSVAIGCVFRTNVEESFKDLFSDAEYVMFENKLELKNASGYKERLEKGLFLK
ncbi:MAG: GGDEF domain-containing protein [Lachnospiraceae bacterium]|nr:GGDEF domain-containing protein [Lachnospiraceae bacterium]